MCDLEHITSNSIRGKTATNPRVRVQPLTNRREIQYNKWKNENIKQ